MKLYYYNFHELSWKANVLARTTMLALNDDTMREAAYSEIQAMLDYLWALNFRPSEQAF